MELLEQMQMNLLARCDKKELTFLRLPHEEMVPVFKVQASSSLNRKSSDFH
jgi:hypothetical protein